MKERGRRKKLTGLVTSNKMDKTVVIQVTRRFKHPLYKKFVLKRNTFKAHDEHNECGQGDTVLVQESRPYSKEKRWRVISIVKRAVI